MRGGAWRLGGARAGVVDAFVCHAWSDDGRTYSIRLMCPAPPATPQAALGNYYPGAPPHNYTFGPYSDPRAYTLAVASLQIGMTEVRLKAEGARRLRGGRRRRRGGTS